MDPNSLHEQLEALHAELATASQTEPRNAERLGKVTADLHRLMHQSTPGAAALGASSPAVEAAAGEPSLPDRLEQLALRFEAAHPTLAATSRRLVDLLGKAGL
jgi:hypothetical protein